jgi:hypothetical protein
MADKPVWREEWEQDYDGFVDSGWANDGPGLIGDVRGDTGERNEARAKLAAAAPALVRALLLSEWPCVEGDEGSVGPECQGCESQGPRSEYTHRTSCPVDAALTLAGFPDETSRDAARDILRAK